MRKQIISFCILLLYLTPVMTTLLTGTTADHRNITIAGLQQHVEYLSSERLGGRYPGTEGDSMAAAYIRDQFIIAGLDPFADNGFQYFPVITGIAAGENNTFTLNDCSAEPGSEFTPFPFSGNSDLTAEVVFCGYGFSINEYDLQWDDYSEVDQEGKWVMVLRGNPEPDDAASMFATHSNDRWKAYVAAGKGASGMIMVSGEVFDKEDNLAEIRTDQGRVGIPVIQVTRTLANSILAKSGRSVEELESAILKEMRPVSFNTGTTVTARADIIVKEAQTMNIVAGLRGNDAEFEKEYIVIGAHFDHLGMGLEGTGSRRPGSGIIHPGADDNASGVAALIEIAARLSANREILRRNYLFIAFGAEEKGLLGSKFFIENPVVNLSYLVTMINLDMIGRKNENGMLQVGGTGTSAEGEEIINSINTSYGFNTVMFQEGFGPSDHASFYAKDIPVYFLSTGAHSDYHTPDDTAEKINYRGLKSISDFTFDLAVELGTRDASLSFREAGPRTPSVPRHGNRRVTLGIMPDFTHTGGDGLRADFVTAGRPAEQGGMKQGDVITAINGHPVNDIYEYMYRLEQLNPGEIINVEIRRQGKTEILILYL